MKLPNLLLKLLFVFMLVSVSYYIAFVQTEKYASTTVLMIKDLSQEQSVSPLGSLLLSSGSESTQDAKLLELYIGSSEMFWLLDREFNLTSYYSSGAIDPLHRLSSQALFPFWQASKEHLLEYYRDDLLITYDIDSSTLEVSFAHADASIAQKVVKRIVYHASQGLNRFEQENAEVILKFLKEQEQERYRLFIDSMQNLLTYQAKHTTLDPKIEVESKNSIIATLEGELVQKEVEYKSKRQYLNPSTPEMKLLKSTMNYIQKSIASIKQKVAGKQELNVDISDFELLQSEVEFNKLLYSQTLAKLEETRTLVEQNTKNLIVVSQPGIADSYAYPNKLKDILTIVMVMMLLYGLLSMLITIIKDHKD